MRSEFWTDIFWTSSISSKLAVSPFSMAVSGQNRDLSGHHSDCMGATQFIWGTVKRQVWDARSTTDSSPTPMGTLTGVHKGYDSTARPERHLDEKREILILYNIFTVFFHIRHIPKIQSFLQWIPGKKMAPFLSIRYSYCTSRNFLAENTRISLNVVGFLEIFFKEFICIKKENYLVNVYNLSSQLISIRLSPFLKFIHLRYVISNYFTQSLLLHGLLFLFMAYLNFINNLWFNGGTF
jgi:hypothetical protein